MGSNILPISSWNRNIPLQNFKIHYAYSLLLTQMHTRVALCTYANVCDVAMHRFIHTQYTHGCIAERTLEEKMTEQTDGY